MRKAFTIWELLAVCAIIGILAAILFPVLSHKGHRHAPRSSCQSNLKQVGLGFKQYAEDYDEAYPLTYGDEIPVSGGYGWADVLQPYLKSTQIFQCPSEENKTPQENLTQIGYTDYWMNANFAGKEDTKIGNANSAILLGDGNAQGDITNARYCIKSLPDSWRTDTKSPAYRHIEGMNLAFADGHVKWFKAEKFFKDTSGPMAPTFSIQVLETQIPKQKRGAK